MKGIKRLLLLGLILAFVGQGRVLALETPLKEGDKLPDIKLPIPKDPEHRSYLGLSGEGTFGIGDLKTKVVILQIFSST